MGAAGLGGLKAWKGCCQSRRETFHFPFSFRRQANALWDKRGWVSASSKSCLLLAAYIAIGGRIEGNLSFLNGQPQLLRTNILHLFLLLFEDWVVPSEISRVRFVTSKSHRSWASGFLPTGEKESRDKNVRLSSVRHKDV